MLATADRSHAAAYDPSDAFYWSMPGGNASAGIAVSSDGNFVYVGDTTARRIVEFDSDGWFVRAWSYKRETPSSVTTDSFGNVYVLFPKTGTIVKFSGEAKKVKVLASWNVPFAGSIAATRGGSVFVLTNFLNAVGEYNTAGKPIGGFVANLPGQWFPRTGFDPRYWPQTGYDAPYKTVARAIAVDPSGDPIIVGDSYQALSSVEPDCSVPDDDLHINTHPYPDPLDSGEVARFTPGGSPISYGWLSLSQQNCYNGIYQQSPGVNVAYGWQSNGTYPGAVAVDPNAGDVYAVASDQLGIRHLPQDLGETFYGNVNAPSYYCGSLDCPARDWDLLAGNPPAGTTLDCHSNLYMVGGGAAGDLIAKFVNQDPVPPGSCVNLSRFEPPPPSLVVFRLHVGKLGKGTVLAGCSGRLCNGSFVLRASSALCRNCALSRPRHFRLAPGLQRPLSFQLTRIGRRLLRIDPGIAIKLLGRLRGGRKFALGEILRGPATLGEACAFPATAGGAADVAGTLAPARGGQRITIQYLPPRSGGSLLPAVQRTVLTDRGGRFHDRQVLNGAGRWTIAASWAGNRIHEPAAPQPCSGTVQQIQTRITLNCPAATSAGAPSPFDGVVSGAPPGALISLAYVAPPNADIGHTARAVSTGGFSDSFSPTAPGLWLALATYKGDAGHAPAEAVCQFTVAPDDFSIGVNPSSGGVAQGASAHATITTAVTSGTAQALSLSASGAPGTVTFSPASIAAGGSSAVTFATSPNTVPGRYVIKLTATGPWASHSTTYTLTVR